MAGPRGARPAAPRLPERLAAAYAALREVPLRSALTVEPGGQLELSSPPAASLTECLTLVSADLDAVRAVLRGDGLTLAGLGHDPWQTPRRFLRQPRYDAMEAALDRARRGRPVHDVHLRLGAGVRGRRHEEPGPLGHVRRWWMAHLLGAVLVAVFANSPSPRAGPPAGSPHGSCAGRRSAPGGPERPRWTPTRAAPGPGMCWTRP